MSERFENLVPAEKRNCLAKGLDYEVLLFATKVEWESCETEKELKKRIWAKFRDYDAAVAYAGRVMAGNTHYHKVLLRA